MKVLKLHSVHQRHTSSNSCGGGNWVWTKSPHHVLNCTECGRGASNSAQTSKRARIVCYSSLRYVTNRMGAKMSRAREALTCPKVEVPPNSLVFSMGWFWCVHACCVYVVCIGSAQVGYIFFRLMVHMIGTRRPPKHMIFVCGLRVRFGSEFAIGKPKSKSQTTKRDCRTFSAPKRATKFGMGTTW